MVDKIKILTIGLLLFLCSATYSYSQEVYLEMDFDMGVPKGEFGNQLDRMGYGFGLMGGYKFKNSPVMAGLDFGFMNFGKDVRETALSHTIPDLRVDVENSYNLIRTNLLLRMIGPPSVFRPYIDGLFGFNYFYTETVVRRRGSFSSEDETLRDTNFDDVTLSYGMGAGINVRVYRNPLADEHDNFSHGSIYLNFSGKYMFGREAEYLQEGSITIDEASGEAFYDVSQSATNLLYIKIGVVVQF